MIAPLLMALALAQTPAPVQTPTHMPPTSTQVATPVPVEPPVLSTELSLRVDNHTLRLALLKLQVQAEEKRLQDERAALDAAIAAAHKGWRMDWNTGRLVQAPEGH